MNARNYSIVHHSQTGKPCIELITRLRIERPVSTAHPTTRAVMFERAPLAIVVILTQAAPYYNYIEGQISSRQEGL